MISINFKRLIIAADCATFVLIGLGGVVRLSGSGLGCPDWPLCHGQIIPPFDLPTLIEYTHRLAATLTTILIVAAAVYAWRKLRAHRFIFLPSLAALILLVVQILVGGLTVLLQLPPTIVAVHLSNAMLIFAALLIATTFAFRPAPAIAGNADDQHLRRLARASLAGTFLLIVSGTIVTGTFAGFTCATWPLCNDQILPDGLFPQIAMLHRVIAGLIGVLILYTFHAAGRAHQHHRALIRAGAVAVMLFIAQIIIGALNVFSQFPVSLNLAHLAAAAAFWGAMVVFTVLAYQGAARDAEQAPLPRSHRSNLQSLISNYVLLTKPWIVVLLLVTTACAMFVAARGMPPLPILFFTLLGGACAAGGANALNSYIDRAVDKQMARTSQRPLPNGRVTPRAALIFALSLCFASVVVLSVFVNGLSAALAFAGIVYYAGIYTKVLKRASAQNIVIGGAAGALPPLVGWAAVTNELNLFAIYLFLIIFYWTPPHTWALMLMLTKDYTRVGIPMMPAAWGETETYRQIFLYSLLLVAITLIPFSLNELGGFYLGLALALGIWFVVLAARLNRDASKQSARRLYMYSNAYLALLFLAMVIDRSLI
ncbi:MAG: protoheme IX farnesyltransferase [Chloroflexi bacterium]|nr:protoheme IX farnesyltransferase [Chloroflexota bacterium]